MDGTIGMSNFSFGTKAETLEILYENKNVINAQVLKPYYFTVETWRNNSTDVLNELTEVFREIEKLIVRSSAKNEDTDKESQAGRYESIVCENDCSIIKDAINEVISSYGEPQEDDQVLVQEAITDAECSGVAFSREPSTGGYYYVINYDDTTGSTSSVTSGTGSNTKLFYWFAGSEEYPDDFNMSMVCRTIEKLVDFTDCNNLDIEFLVSKGNLYILQVRQLVIPKNKVSYDRQKEAVRRISMMIRHQNCKKPFLYGNRTIYGVMPDWNPAEMIGIHPRNLAASIYKELITDNVWAYQRDNYGYKKLRSFPLMVDFCGYPYIDVRVSFNSFIPEELDCHIADRLVNYYLDRLEESPDKHDKVEFDIVFSCYTFDLSKRIKVLEEYGFSEKEIKDITDSLRDITRRISDNDNGLWKSDAKKLAILEQRREEIEKSNLRDIDKVFWLIEDCKRYGTLPFAGLARAGFIAVQLLKSMVSEDIITEEENNRFMNDLETVGSSMRNDYLMMDKNDFLNKYGFLRPGTYDICSKRYDEEPELYFSWHHRGEYIPQKKDSFRLSLTQMEHIRKTIKKHGLGEDVLGLFSFIKGAIEWREKAKFIFTKSVSDILKYIGEWGEKEGFSREEMSYLDIRIVKDVYNGSVDEKEVISNSITTGKKAFEEGEGIILPPLIVDEDTVKEFYYPDSQPNFITQNRVSGDVISLDNDIDSTEIDNKILLIESADPGFDWIFSHEIKGFITKYGGANSHMAIRAGELNIPAAIGVGDRLYKSLNHAKIVEIDSPKRIINILRQM